MAVHVPYDYDVQESNYCSKSQSPGTAIGKVIKLSERHTFCLEKAQNCAYSKVGVILKSGQCDATEN
jgi:hypothetical protein